MVDQGIGWEGGTEGIKYFPGLASATRSRSDKMSGETSEWISTTRLEILRVSVSTRSAPRSAIVICNDAIFRRYSIFR